MGTAAAAAERPLACEERPWRGQPMGRAQMMTKELVLLLALGYRG